MKKIKKNLKIILVLSIFFITSGFFVFYKKEIYSGISLILIGLVSVFGFTDSFEVIKKIIKSLFETSKSSWFTTNEQKGEQNILLGDKNSGDITQSKIQYQKNIDNRINKIYHTYLNQTKNGKKEKNL